ncbi:MAG: flagellar hook-basal body complex protein FliE [Rhodospirillaceae bacterium]|jgi:flagellar hook-basal body complex protein FliE|nr:flagellar hook-basal body complex protein FliE [Rhodospirillaceae bacterium]
MADDFGSAINAHREAAGAVREAGQTGNALSPADAGGGSFAGMVQASLSTAKEAGMRAEQLSMAQIAGEENMVEVVTAVANAEHTLETVVAVRDKVLQAYQEILRMPI